jgi:hypothetical protein
MDFWCETLNWFLVRIRQSPPEMREPKSKQKPKKADAWVEKKER